MIQNGNIKVNTNVKLPLAFILYALVAFVIAQLIFFTHADLLFLGQFRTPSIWMGAHFLLLGFVVMIIMGAMYQLVPVAFLTPIWSQTLAYIQYIITVIGVSLFAYLLGIYPSKAIYGGAIAVLGICMFIFQMLRTIFKQQNKNMMTSFVIGAIICFLLTIIIGFLLVWNLAFGVIIDQDLLLVSHMIFGVAGWFTLLIFGFSYKLVPMFSLSHGYSMKFAKPSFFFYSAGLLILVGSYIVKLNDIETIGWFFLFLGFSCFALDIKEILNKRIRKRLDKAFSFTLFAICNGLIIHFIALLFSLSKLNSPVFWGWLIFLYITVWIIFSILGYLYKIVPFLWWTHKYSNKIGKEKVPTMAEMVNEKVIKAIFILFIIGVLGLIIGMIIQASVAIFVFQGLLMIASVFYVISIVNILFV